MSLKNRSISLLAAAIGIVGFSSFVLAQDNSTMTPAPDKTERHMRGDGHRGGFGHGGMMRMFHDLDLTDAQKTQIHSIMEANKPDKAAWEEARTLRQAKRDGTITAEQQERLTALRTQQKEKMQSVHTQILAVLTPDQLAKLEQKKQERKQKWEDRKMRHQQNPSTTTDKPAVQ
jgi:Spy/CpxP family protein refolding chaperone